MKEEKFLKINKLKINAYGKLQEKEMNFTDNINIVYGKNEAGKSTLLNFITNCFYGISKNKKGKDISDFEKYIPWIGEDFSGKLEYELDNQEKYEIFRDFRKKNPKIFNEKMEDISKEFNIDKSKGNEFFYEQTKVDEALFLSTVLVNQKEVTLEKQEQNVLIQKIANLVGTGDDNVSFKRAIDRIDRRRLDEIGTERSRERPVNIIGKKIEELQKEKKELEKYENVKYEIEEKKNYLEQEIENLENENQFLKEIKLINDNEKIENEKINLKINLKDENNAKINLIKNKIEEIHSNHENIFEENKKINTEKNKLNKKIAICFLAVFLINILQFVLIQNFYFKCGILFLTASAVLAFNFFSKSKIKKKELDTKNDLEKVKSEINNLNREKDLLEKNNKALEEEINKLENDFNLKISLEKEKIENKYFGKIVENRINELAKLEDINLEIQNLENKLNSKKIALHTLDLDYENIAPKLEDLSSIEEELVENTEKMRSLRNLEKSINLAKEVLNQSNEKMKNTVTPKFTEELSKTIAEITNGKYTNVRLNDDTGLMVELENGNYIPVARLSIGTIDQLYLSLRLALVEDLSEEKMPVILDESFAYYDTERLKNILRYIVQRFSGHQVIIFTCTHREKEALEKLDSAFNWIEM